MTQKEHFGYADRGDLQGLQLPDGGNELPMVVLLPKKTDGLADLKKQLTLENLRRWTNGPAKANKNYIRSTDYVTML